MGQYPLHPFDQRLVGDRRLDPQSLCAGPQHLRLVSAGSGAAVAASLAAAALGTETNGSLVCPGSFNGIVSLKPTVGLVSRTHIVPISHTQDTAGPMTRNVADAALLLSAMAGSDPEDAATRECRRASRRLAAALRRRLAQRGKRLGVILPPPDHSAARHRHRCCSMRWSFLQAQGAEIVEIHDFKPPAERLRSRKAWC